jgi:cytochrome c-type biogenesis protein CcmH/NrfG
VRTVNPLTLDPLFTAANAESNIAAGLLRQRGPGWRPRYAQAISAALGYLKQATVVQPSSAYAWFELGTLEYALGCPYAALPSFSHSTVLDGQNPSYAAGYAATLAQVNSGKYKC